MRAPWIVTLVCGASGAVTSSRVARPLAERYGVPLAEADDVVTALQAITTPEQQPILHFWTDQPPRVQVLDAGADRRAAFRGRHALRPAYAAVIADHVEFAAPVVFEGDYLLPELAAEAGHRGARGGA